METAFTQRGGAAALGRADVNLNQLYYFVVTCENDNNMTKAAEHLVISQSAISYAVRNLEREFNMPLFRRTGGSLELTNQGREFYRRASKIIGETRALSDYFHRGRPSGSNPIAVGMTTLARNVFSRVLSRVGTSIPVTLEKLFVFRSDELFRALDHGDVDLVVIGTSYLDDFAEYESEILGDWRSSLYVSSENPIAKQRTVKIEQLADIPLVLYLENAKARGNYKRTLEAFVPGIELNNVKGMATELSSVVDSIRNAGCATVLGHGAIRDVPDVVPIPIEGVLPYQFGAFWRRGEEPSDAVRLLLERLKEHLADVA